MSWLSKTKQYDRTRILRQARRASARGKHGRAADLYQRILEAEPDNQDVKRRLVAQRVRAGQRDEAWQDCQTVAKDLVERGFLEQAIGVYRDFATTVRTRSRCGERSPSSSWRVAVRPTPSKC